MISSHFSIMLGPYYANVPPDYLCIGGSFIRCHRKRDPLMLLSKEQREAIALEKTDTGLRLILGIKA